MKKRQKSPPPPGPHFSAGELVDICSTSELAPSKTEGPVIQHLALLCPDCWAAVDDLPPLDHCVPTTVTGLALIRLAAPPATHLELSANHRAAIAAARRQPLGFCRLFVEESWWVVKRRLRRGPPSVLRTLSGRILANGACLYAPREAHDLQAHLLALFAHACSWANDMPGAREAVALARAHLARGRGEAEPKATLLDVEAQLEYRKGKAEAAWMLLEEAREALEGYQPPDRQAEILLLQGMIIARYDDQSLSQAAVALRKGLAILDQLPADTNPSLRRDLTHNLAVSEADNLFQNRLLGKPYDGPDAAAIEQMIGESEPPDQQNPSAARTAAERAAIRGKLLVFTDSERAQAAFREAMLTYFRISDRHGALKLRRELFLLRERAADCGIRGVDGSFLARIFEPREEEASFSELIFRPGVGFPARPEGALEAEIGKLQAAIRGSSREAGR